MDLVFWLLIGIGIELGAFILVFLGVIKLPSKRAKISARRTLDKWYAEFPSGERRKIEYRELWNGQWLWKFEGWSDLIPLAPEIDIKAVTITPDDGKMLFKVFVEMDGFKPYAQPVYDALNEGKSISRKEFNELKNKEREMDALKEDVMKPATSLEKTVSDSFDEDHAENIYAGKEKLFEALLRKGKTPKKKSLESELIDEREEELETGFGE